MSTSPLGNKHAPKTRIFEITQGFARYKKLPRFFVAKPIAETAKAFYLYGHGTLETVNTGNCCVCARELTHPVSITLGIGPICGGHHWDWDLVGGFTEANVERLKREIGTLIRGIKIDTWIPKSRIIQTTEPKEEIQIPSDHPMLKGNGNSNHPQMNVKGTTTGRIPAEAPRRAILGHSKSMNQWVIMVYFPYNVEDLDHIRAIPGRKFIDQGPGKKFWITPLNVEIIEQLDDWGFHLEDRLWKYAEKARLHVDQLDEIQVDGLGGELYDFQKKGVAFLEAKGGRALIGDEMGLGKTIQALAYLQLHPELRPAVIVVPASLKLNWKREAEAWMTDPSVKIINGTDSQKIHHDDITIINYDILPNRYEKVEGKDEVVEVTHSGWVDYLIDMEPKVLITDECHYYKNSKALRTKAIRKLGKNIPHVIALSGTPIVNRPSEILNSIQLIDPMIFTKLNKDVRHPLDFLKRYCGPVPNKYATTGFTYNGASNTQELHDKLTQTVLIRRKKEDVLPDLPRKVHSFVPMEINNTYEYFSAEANFISWVREQKGREAAERASNAQQLAEIEGLKQLALKGKMDACVDWIRNFLEVDGKLVVFVTHTRTLETLVETFRDVCVKMQGSDSMIRRQEVVDAFQSDESIRLFVGLIDTQGKPAGVGWTLTAASNVAFVEIQWGPGTNDQAGDRCHRIGQEDTVNIYYLLADNTIEERIAQLVDKKRKMLDKVLDGKDTEQESLLTELINSYYE